MFHHCVKYIAKSAGKNFREGDAVPSEEERLSLILDWIVLLGVSSFTSVFGCEIEHSTRTMSAAAPYCVETPTFDSTCQKEV